VCVTRPEPPFTAPPLFDTNAVVREEDRNAYQQLQLAYTTTSTSTATLPAAAAGLHFTRTPPLGQVARDALILAGLHCLHVLILIVPDIHKHVQQVVALGASDEALCVGLGVARLEPAPRALHTHT